METKRITIDVPLDAKAQIDAKCGKFKDYPSMQVYIFGPIQNDLSNENSVKTTDNSSFTTMEEITKNAHSQEVQEDKSSSEKKTDFQKFTSN